MEAKRMDSDSYGQELDRMLRHYEEEHARRTERAERKRERDRREDCARRVESAQAGASWRL